MTSSTNKIQAAANGGISTDRDVQEKPAGAGVRVRAAARERAVSPDGPGPVGPDRGRAHRPGRFMTRPASRWLDHEGTSEPLDRHEISRLLSDAYQCAIKAVNVIDEAAMHWLDGDLPDEPIALR